MPNALITGTSTGIGLDTALHFANQGYRVFAAARKPEVLPTHPGLVPVQLDVNSDESVQRCVAAVLAQAGSIDVLVNNAGIGHGGAVEMVPMEWIRAMFETNYFGAVRMIQAVVPSMRERRSGTVVNVTSMLGHATLGGHGYYASTKFALGALSEALAVEVRAHGIGVAIIEPGVILTPIWQKGESLMPEGHPYQQVMARLYRNFGVQLADGTPSQVVAEAIYAAVQENGRKVRYPVGPDADVIAAARDRMSAQEWVDLFAEPDEEKFMARARDAFGEDLYNPPSLYARSKGASA